MPSPWNLFALMALLLQPALGAASGNGRAGSCFSGLDDGDDQTILLQAGKNVRLGTNRSERLAASQRQLITKRSTASAARKPKGVAGVVTDVLGWFGWNGKSAAQTAADLKKATAKAAADAKALLAAATTRMKDKSTANKGHATLKQQKKPTLAADIAAIKKSAVDKQKRRDAYWADVADRKAEAAAYWQTQLARKHDLETAYIAANTPPTQKPAR